MKALCFDTRVQVRDVEPPAPGPGEALIAVRLAGICGTDLEVVRGYRGYRGVLGHEMVGEVVRCPDAPTWEGRRVTGEINLGCGACPRCAAGQGKHCARRRVMGIVAQPGCFAEQIVLPIANLHAVPEGLADEQAVFAEPLAAAFEIFEQLELGARTSVAVIGDGRLGLLITMALHARGVATTVVGRHPAKLERVAGCCAETLAPQALGERRFEVIVEATGSPSGLELALEHVQPRGSIVLKSTYHGRIELDAARIVVDEIRLLGSRCGPFDVALAAMADGRVDPRALIDARYPLAEGVAAVAHAGQRGVLKVLLEASAAPAHGSG